MRRRFDAEKFIVYFQPYTNTYAPVDTLRRLYDNALAADDSIVGIAVGTRPDCVDDDVLDLLAGYSQDFYPQDPGGFFGLRTPMHKGYS